MTEAAYRCRFKTFSATPTYVRNANLDSFYPVGLLTGTLKYVAFLTDPNGCFGSCPKVVLFAELTLV